MSDPKKDDKKDEKKPDEGGGRFNMGGLLNRIPGRGGEGDKKPDDKKPTDKKDDKKPDEGSGGLAGIASGLTGRLGGMFNRGGGDSADKKPADDPKKPVPPPGSSSSSASSAAPQRPGGMGPSSSSPSSSSSAPGSRPGGTGPIGSSSSSSSAPGSRPGGAPPPSSSAAPSRPGGPTTSSSTSAGAAKPKDDKASETDSGGGFLAGLRSRLPFGRGAETAVAASAAAGAAAKPGAAATPSKPGPGATSQTKQAAAKTQAAPEGGGGIWEWMTGKRRAPATEPQSRTLREGSTRLPQADTSGWNLDTKLDLIGIGLILGAVVLGLSALSAEQANVTGSINRFIGQLLGWGAFAVPMTMGGVGIFLLVTRFGDSPPELDMVRIAGVVLAYIGLLTLFQYIEVLGPRYQCDLDCFRIVVQRSYQDGRGGGIIGMNTHLFLVENIGEIGGFVFVMGLLLVAGMLITRTTATELMVLFVSLYRSFRVSWQHQSQRRAAQRQIAATRRAEAARITVSRPGALETGRAEVRQPALPMGAEPMVRVGGQVVTSASADSSPASAQAGAAGAFRGLLNRLPGRKPEAAPAAAPSSPLVTQRSAESGSASFAPPINQPAAASTPSPVPMMPPPPPAPTPAQVQPAAAAQPVSAPANPTAVEGPTVGVAPNLPITPPKAPPLVHSTTPRHDYNVPEFRQLLNPGSKADYDRKALVERARIIQETLESFGAPGKVVEINTGPVITQFGVEPGYVTQRDRQSRVKVSAIAQLDKDLQLSLGARSIRIEAPVPGKGYVGIEVPNDNPMTVSLRDVMEANRFQRIKSPLAIALGESVDGTPVAADLTSMPHLLIAGTTGSGKSVCVNAIIASLLLRNTPDQVKFIMVDPKRVELTGYNGIPHLIAPVVVDVERIIGVLKWLTREMDDRYKKFSVAGARNIDDYNRNRAADAEAMPYIVAIIDELADLMMLAPEEAERYITRVAAMARATGIHLVIATQRPSADVVTGLIKANFPARIAFAVAGNVDSRVILDQPGAEKLLGRGDMLYLSADSPSAQRLQGVFVSDSELNSIIRYWKAQAADQPQKPAFNFGIESDEGNKSARSNQQSSYNRPTVGTQQQIMPPGLFDDVDEDDDYEEEDGGGSEDDLFERAVELVRRQNGASVSLLQRKMRIGYARAARLIDAMEERGIVGPQKEGSSKQRDVLVPK
jgi:S-DNA-T family DNA segregation ATPase FtsK/SpoIIIE